VKSQFSNATSGVWYLKDVMGETAYCDVIQAGVMVVSHFKKSPKQLAG